MDLGATKGCQEAIKCLKMHCQLLKGSTSKEVLEVFYQEIGHRLIASVPLAISNYDLRILFQPELTLMGRLVSYRSISRDRSFPSMAVFKS